MSTPQRPEPPETDAARAGADIELTTTGTAGAPKRTDDDAARHPDGEPADRTLTTDPEAQRDDLLVEPENS